MEGRRPSGGKTGGMRARPAAAGTGQAGGMGLPAGECRHIAKGRRSLLPHGRQGGDTAWLPMEIGVLLRHGLTLDTALEAVTVNPARLVGAIDRIGTIEPGKDADIAIFDGMPFSNQTLCRFTMIDGVIWNDTLPQNEKTEETNGKRL